MPRPSPATEKVQFSVMFEVAIKEKLDLIASVTGESVSQHLESLVRAEIEAIDDKTWQAMNDVRAKVLSATGRKLDTSEKANRTKTK